MERLIRGSIVDCIANQGIPLKSLAGLDEKALIGPKASHLAINHFRDRVGIPTAVKTNDQLTPPPGIEKAA